MPEAWPRDAVSRSHSQGTMVTYVTIIMLQVTGHAGGVPKATLERGRSVEFPSEGNYLFNNLTYERKI